MTNSNPTTVTVTNHTGYSEQQQPNREGAGITPPEATIIAVCIASVFIVIGWFVIHRQTLHREREARAHAAQNAREDRIRLFEGFLVEKEQIVEASATESIFEMYFAKDGLLNAGLFRKEATKVRRGIPPERRAEFDRLDDALGRMSPNFLSAHEKVTRKEKAAYPEQPYRESNKADDQRTNREKLADAIRDVRNLIRAV